jgi:hypothetical protein
MGPTVDLFRRFAARPAKNLPIVRWRTRVSLEDIVHHVAGRAGPPLFATGTTLFQSHAELFLFRRNDESHGFSSPSTPFGPPRHAAQKSYGNQL